MTHTTFSNELGSCFGSKTEIEILGKLYFDFNPIMELIRSLIPLVPAFCPGKSGEIDGA